jgi:FKBP-type peptidyl-prolyl cis-trans isomerase 2
MRNSFVRVLSLLLCVMFMQGCYSFTGASLPAHIKTVAIPLADDISGFGQSNVRQRVTDLLIERFAREGSLQVTNRSRADALIEATITNITDENVGVQANEQLTTKRVSIVASVVYRDQKNQKDFWERRFQKSSDYAIEQGQAGLQSALQIAEDQLAEDILMAVISNW